MNNKFGRRYDPDERDNQYPLRGLINQSMSDAARHRKVKLWRSDYWSGNQGNRPACVGYGWAHWLNALPIGQWLNPDGIYNIAQMLDCWDGEEYAGTSVRAGAKALLKLGYISSYHWTFNVDDLTDALLYHGPVVVGTNWYDGMMDPDSDNLIHPTGDNVGGHAYLLNGIDTKYKVYRLKNSWGFTWGNAGTAWIKIDEFARLLAEQGECCIGVEQRVSK